jgi:adenylate cyclase class 2
MICCLAQASASFATTSTVWVCFSLAEVPSTCLQPENRNHAARVRGQIPVRRCGRSAGGAWLRLRDEGTRSTLALKQVTDATTIDGTTEIETEVTDLPAMGEILHRLGLREVRYQENYREEWRLGEVVFDFDTWPGLPTFVEVEGPDEASVRQAASAAGLDYAAARFGSVDEIYQSETGRDILAEPTLLFASAENGAAASGAAQVKGGP